MVLKKLMGIILLVTALSIYLYNSYVGLVYREVYDDMVSWFHLHVISYIKAGGNIRSDHVLRFIGGRDLSRSPILSDYALAYTGIPPSIWTLSMGVLYILLVFTVSYMVSKNYVVSGLAATLLASIPTFTYWFRYNMYGSYTLQAIWFLTILLLYLWLRSGRKLYAVISTVLAAYLWLSWTSGWLVLFVYAVYVLALIYKGVIEEKHLLPGILLIAATLPLNIVTGIYYITVYHIFSYTFLSVSIILAYLVCRFRSGLSDYSFTVIRIVSSFTSFPLALYILLFIINYYEPPGAYEDYMKVYNPVFDYGVVGLFSLLALILVIRSRALQEIRFNPIAFMLMTSFVVGVLLAYIIHPLSVIAASSISIFVAYGFYIIASTLFRVGKGRSRILFGFIAVWIVVGGIVANAIPSYSIASTPPNIYYQDIFRELMRKHRFNESSLLIALNTLRHNVSGEALVIAYWGYSYWITGYTLSKASTLADPQGSLLGHKLVSAIFINDEETAYNMIKSLLGNSSSREAYVLVSEVVSINYNELKRGYKIADLGGVIIIPPTAPNEQAKTSFRPYGDLNRVFRYIELAGLDVNQYIDVAKARYVYETPLAWRHAMLDTLLIKLVVNALKSEGYDVVNDVYSELPLRVSGLYKFKLVNVTLTPLYRVTQDIYDYQIYYMTAIYKVEL